MEERSEIRKLNIKDSTVHTEWCSEKFAPPSHSRDVNFPLPLPANVWFRLEFRSEWYHFKNYCNLGVCIVFEIISYPFPILFIILQEATEAKMVSSNISTLLDPSFFAYVSNFPIKLNLNYLFISR